MQTCKRVSNDQSGDLTPNELKSNHQWLWLTPIKLAPDLAAWSIFFRQFGVCLQRPRVGLIFFSPTPTPRVYWLHIDSVVFWEDSRPMLSLMGVKVCLSRNCVLCSLGGDVFPLEVCPHYSTHARIISPTWLKWSSRTMKPLWPIVRLNPN